MKNKKKGSRKLLDPEVGSFTAIVTPSNAKLIKASGNIGPTSTPKTFPYITAVERAQYYKEAADELFWKYKASKAINQKLLSFLTKAGFVIYENPTGTLNITRLESINDSAPTTSETGQRPILSKSLDYDKLKKEVDSIEVGKPRTFKNTLSFNKILPKGSGIRFHVDSKFKDEPKPRTKKPTYYFNTKTQELSQKEN